ncbi:hypothetical protein cypCar_00049026 [Cyprinus carpio]|nr:hypothetical protein cypCar_00049026 [Cyprinus carpio]
MDHLTENNFTAQTLEYPVCSEWKENPEGSVFHLAHILLVLGFMGGSGFYGLLYMFSFLTLGFFCYSIWAWSDPCTTDSFSWTFALFAFCLAQVVHGSYRLRSVTFDKEFQDLYDYMFKKLGVSLTHFGKIVECCEGDIYTIDKDHCFAVEGKTSIDKLSVLISGRIRVTLNGEFLHHIYPFQFLDSPEWDSLRPSEEGVFQLENFRMSDTLSYTTSPLPSSVPSVSGDSNATLCQDWEQSHHLLFHLANLSLGLGFLIPTTVTLHMIFLRLLLMTGTERPQQQSNAHTFV